MAIKKIKPALANGLDGRSAVNCCKSLQDQKQKLRLVEAETPSPKASKTSGKLAGKFIKQVSPTNPRRAGTHGHASFETIIASGGELSYEDYIAKGGRSNDLRWDLEHGYVQVSGQECTCAAE